MTQSPPTGARRSSSRAVRAVSAAIGAVAMITAGVALNVAPVSAATASNTLTVNANTTLRSVTHVASGSLYGLANASQPSSSVASAIKPSEFVQKPQGGAQQPDGDILTVAPTASAVGAKLVSRFIDYYSGWPYSFNSSNWLSVVDNQISQYKASSYYGIISAYAPFNEPDNTWNTSNGTFNDIWVKTYNEIRAKDSSKPIQGPSFSDNISGNSRAPSMQAFLQNAKNTNTVPDILAWHELSNAAKIAGDISTVQGIEDSLGISRRPIDIEEYAAPAEVGIPGPLVGYIAKFERLGVTHAELPFWNQSGALGDTLTGKGGSPNAAYWMYTWYAAMSGNMVQVNAPAQTGIDGFAAVPSGNNQVSIVVGGCSGSCAVTVNGLNSLSLGSTVSVKIEQTVSAGRTVAVSGPSTISTTTYTPSNGTISVPITMVTNNAYRITITPGSGGGATPTPTPTPTSTGAPNATISINSGGSATGSFTADQYFSGGTAYTNTNTVDESQITSNVPPAAVFQSERYGAMTYTIPNRSGAQTVTLYFDETYVTAAGQRVFNVTINGSTVLSSFDIYASAGGQNRAIARTFNTTANSSGQVVIGFVAGTENPKVNGITVAAGSPGPTPTATATPTATPTGTTSISINSGGSATGSFTADQYFSGGSTYTSTATIDMSQITTNPPPAAVLQSERYGAMTYTIPNLTAGRSYTVTLYFAENYVTAAGQRLFNVTINGTTVLSSFDIYASAGGQNRAIARTFTTTANSSGQVVIGFTAGTENPKVNGITVTG